MKTHCKFFSAHVRVLVGGVEVLGGVNPHMVVMCATQVKKKRGERRGARREPPLPPSQNGNGIYVLIIIVYLLYVFS